MSENLTVCLTSPITFTAEVAARCPRTLSTPPLDWKQRRSSVMIGLDKNGRILTRLCNLTLTNRKRLTRQGNG